jgi:exopolyphosphatase / guanosine-5'-triphosphate,3'-diphosphate pyrophosphatase
MGDQRDRLFLVGGSWRAFARVDMLRRNYPLLVLHEYRMSRADVSATVGSSNASLPDLIARTGISEARLSLVPVAAQVLKRTRQDLQAARHRVSSYGIREGMLYEQMPQRLRDRDPLIEACRFAEEKDSRLPGFGDQLFTFIKPLFRNADEERARIIRAACLLHDVSWRAHPDYRHEVCFDYATRANLGGLNHRERSTSASRSSTATRTAARARASSRSTACSTRTTCGGRGAGQGHALRRDVLGPGRRPDGRAALVPKKKVLELRLARGSEALFGEVAEARFKSLVQASLGATHAVPPLITAVFTALPPEAPASRPKPHSPSPGDSHTRSTRFPHTRSATSRRGTIRPNSRHSLTTFGDDSGENKKKPTPNPCTKAQDQWHIRAQDSPS